MRSSGKPCRYRLGECAFVENHVTDSKAGFLSQLIVCFDYACFISELVGVPVTHDHLDIRLYHLISRWRSYRALLPSSSPFFLQLSTFRGSVDQRKWVRLQAGWGQCVGAPQCVTTVLRACNRDQLKSAIG